MSIRKFTLTLVLATSFGAILYGRDIRTRGGEFFRDVSGTKIEQMGIRISHRDGTRFIDFKDLPSDVQKEFGFNEQLYATTLAANREREALVEVQRRASAAALESQKLADIESRAEIARRAEVAAQISTTPIGLAAPAPSNSSISQRDFSSRNYAARDIAARDYTPPRYVAPPSYVPPSSSSGTVQVHGYYRKNGTYVSGYTRRK